MKKTNVIALVAMLMAGNLLSSAQTVSSRQDEKTGLYGFVDEDDNYVVKPVYKEVDFYFGDHPGLSKVVNKNDKAGFVNETGKEVVPCKYDETGSSFEEGYIVVKIKSGEGDFDFKHGLMDQTGKEVIPVKYEHLEYYPEDKVLIAGETRTSDVGLMDPSGKWIIPAQYAFWSKEISKGIWPVGKDNKCGVVNLKNGIVVPFEYDMIEGYSSESNVAPAKKDGKYGFIDRTGKVVIPFIYDDAWTSSIYLIVEKGEKSGVIDLHNNIILPVEYANISSVNIKTAWVAKNEKEETYEIDLITKQKVKR